MRAAAWILSSPQVAAAGMASYYSRLCRPRHLFDAWNKISKSNKFSKGFDEQTIKDFADHLGENILELNRELRKKTFEFAPARGVLAEKPGGKRRPIKVPSVRDRVVLTGIRLLISPKFEAFDLDCSFGYVKHRNVGDAIDAVMQLAARGRKFVLEADIKSFFDTVDQALLLEMFTKEIRAGSLRPLLERAIRVEVGNLSSFTPFDREMFPASDSGIPQGGVLSPMLANFYLHKFDAAMTRRGFALVRYADDFVVMCSTKQEALDAYNLCLEILEGQLKLKMHHLEDASAKTKITSYGDGFAFLGIQFKDGKIFPVEKVVNRFKERIASLTDPTLPGTILGSLVRLNNVVKGWGKAFMRYDIEQLFQELDQYIRESLTQFLRHHGFYRSHHSLGKHHVKVLGLPSLSTIRSAAMTPQKKAGGTP